MCEIVLHTNSGGYWLDPEEVANDEKLEPYIFMELIPFNSIQVQDRGLLKTSDSKLLGDITTDIGHLHRTRIVHRDIKPVYVLVRVEDGEILGQGVRLWYIDTCGKNEDENYANTRPARTYPLYAIRSLFQGGFAWKSAPSRYMELWFTDLRSYIYGFPLKYIRKDCSKLTELGRFSKKSR